MRREAMTCRLVDALILEGIFLPSRKLDQIVGPFLGWLAAPFVIPSGWNVMAGVRDLERPILFVHGADDSVTPLAPAARIFAAAQGGQAARKSAATREFWIAEGAGHPPGIAGACGMIYLTHLNRFLIRWLQEDGCGTPPRLAYRPVNDADGSLAIDVTVENPEKAGVPVEIVVVEEADGREDDEVLTQFHRIRLEGGATRELRIPVADDPLFVTATMPAGSVP